MRNPGDKIKILAMLLFILSMICGGIWIISILILYFSSPVSHTNETTTILLTILYPACLILGSLVIFFLMYGFGQLVENSDILVENQRKLYINSEFEDLRKTLAKEEIQK